jgi:hypothetical protein
MFMFGAVAVLKSLISEAAGNSKESKRSLLSNTFYFGAMQPKKHLLSLLGATALGTFAAPALANSTTEQVGTQSATINGDNNQVIQVINQIEINHPGLGNGRTNNPRRGTVQDSYQGATINGDGNSVYQESTQQSVESGNNRPGQRNGRNRNWESNRDDDDDGDKGYSRNRWEDDDDDDDDDDRSRGRGRRGDDDDDDD